MDQGKQSILIIEDDDDFRDVLRKSLELEGYTIATATTGEEGLMQYRRGKFDLVITDILMPDKEGLETIKELKLNNPGIKIIAMSGGGAGRAEDYLELATFFGAVHSIQKPFQVGELLEVMEKLL